MGSSPTYDRGIEANEEHPHETHFFLVPVSFAVIDKQAIVSLYDPIRNASSLTPFDILSSWSWDNHSIQEGTTQVDINSYKGASWLEHDRPVQYDFGGDLVIEMWLISFSTPNPVNLGRIGLISYDSSGIRKDMTDINLNSPTRTTDLWTGILTSRFTWDASPVSLQAAISQEGTDVIFIQITSPLL
ncbi:hypothetical protein DL96DRAFT_1751171 [Flagelloscypha sp. PMI_526]|nr:hypothetical protein DL96DRAFT_1751171 [Flagelloscypha sp. PMI_526]